MKSEINTNAIHDAKIYSAVKHINEGDSLRSVLEEMAAEAKITNMTPADLAQKIMDEVTSYESCYTEVNEDIEKAMDKVFASIADLPYEKRMDVMSQMLFGFELYSDQKLVEQLENGVSVEELYRRNKNEYSDYLKIQLEARLVDKAAKLRLSPAALKRMSKNLCNTGNYVATSAAIGTDSYNLKCAVAMDMYLRNHDKITPMEAAMNACYHVDLETIADGVRVGEIAETVALGLTVAYVIAIAIQAVAMIAAASTLGEMAVIGVMGYFLMEGMTMIGVSLSHQVGKLAAVGTHLAKDGAEKIKEGFDRIISAAEKEQYDDDDMWCYFDEQLHNLETEADYIF